MEGCRGGCGLVAVVFGASLVFRPGVSSWTARGLVSDLRGRGVSLHRPVAGLCDLGSNLGVIDRWMASDGEPARFGLEPAQFGGEPAQSDGEPAPGGREDLPAPVGVVLAVSLVFRAFQDVAYAFRSFVESFL